MIGARVNYRIRWCVAEHCRPNLALLIALAHMGLSAQLYRRDEHFDENWHTCSSPDITSLDSGFDLTEQGYLP